MDQSLISIFERKESSPELLQSLKDISYLAGVLSDLGSQNALSTPIEILRFLRVIQMINEEALGLDDPIENADTLYYRYRNRYHDQEPPDKKRVEQIVNVLVKYNWISKQSRRIKMRDIGKRMMDALIRLANDSLGYYLQDDIGKSLFQARRDAELSEAYDDQGISGGNKIASMIRNVENATSLIKERELEMLADRNALPQLQVMNELMNELKIKLDERFKQFQTLEDSLVLSNLMQQGTGAIAEATNLSLGLINKFLKFSTMQETMLESRVSPEKVRAFIEKMYNPPLESDIPNAHQILSFMEQNQYEGESLDGLWIPVKFAAPISASSIHESVHYLETYEPMIGEIIEEMTEIVYAEEEVDASELDQVMGEAKWILTNSMIPTEQIENYMEHIDEAFLEQVVIEATSSEWADAINALNAVSALVGEKQMTLKEPTNDETTMNANFTKEWEWLNQTDSTFKLMKMKQRRDRKDERGK